MDFFPVESYLYQSYELTHGVNQTNTGQNRHYIANRKLVVHFPKPSNGSTIKWQRITIAIDDTVLLWRFPIATQTAELKYLKDPSSVFKDAVDGQFEQSLSTPNPLNDLSCVLVTKSTHLKILNCHTNCRAEIFEGSFKCQGKRSEPGNYRPVN